MRREPIARSKLVPPDERVMRRVGITHLDPGLVTARPNDGLNPRERTTRLHNSVSAETLSPSIR